VVAALPPEVVVEDRLRAIQGTWDVRRTIIDRLNSSRTCFEGQAIITPVLFEEHGDTFTDVARFRSSRTYRLECDEQHIVIRFPNRSEFAPAFPAIPLSL
jgi:hypothetical protein